jgi:penicillin V acylase-like amidase (Ntn superfamily)
MKSRMLALASAIVIVLMLLSCHHPAALPMSFPKETSLGVSATHHGCTSFCLDNDGYCVFGTNFDNNIHEGLLFVNKRNVSKAGWEANTAGEYARWTSKYGSLTFDLVGYQLAWAGMNEAGLMLSTMALGESRAPDPDERFPLVSPLWIQYQLDNYSTVEEVIASDALVRITSAPPRTVDHYLVCDGSGDCATIEFFEGKMVYHTGETLPAAALTNSVYQDSVRAWQEDGLSDNSLARFSTAADRVTSFEPTDSQRAVEYAFETLTQVSSPSWTMWSIVFDPKNLRVHFRTKWNAEIRHLDFSQLDFACGTPVQMLDVHEELSGDVSDDLITYSHEVNFDHLVNVLEKLGVDVPRDQVETLLQQVESYPCLEGKEKEEEEETVTQETPRDFSWVWPVAVAMLILVPVATWYRVRRRLKRN